MQTEFTPIFEIKEMSEEGTFKGIASVTGMEDLGGDIIDAGAFRKTIAENPIVPILWQHDGREVIGEGSVKEWQGKVLVEGKLDLEDPVAVKAWKKMKRKLVKGLSIGFTTVKSTFEDVEGRIVRHIGELKLWEVSLVTFPMLPAAQVTRVKSADEDLHARVKGLEAQVSALTATKATPTEPAQATEPPVTGNEPAKDHSGLISQLDQLKGVFQYGTRSETH